MSKYYSVDLDLQRDALLKSETAKPVVDEFITLADSCLGSTYEILTFSEFRLFDETGDRTVYQSKYTKRRTDCTALAAALWITGDNKYKKQLEDVVFAICDEFTWCLPAHISFDKFHPDIDTVIGQVDLYNSRTANCLIEVVTMVGDKLSEYVSMRVEYEIRRRIIESVKKRTFSWEDDETNWNITCNSGVLNGIITYGTKEEKDTLLPRFISSVENYIKGFGNDYCCLEGAGYWTAFGNFLYCADMIYCYTKGEVDYFNREDVREIACFPQRVMLNEKLSVTFSDAKSKYSFYPSIQSFMKKLYGDIIYMPDFELRSIANIAMGEGMRELLWLDTNYKESELNLEIAYFKYSEWYVKRGEKYSFAAKGGNNAEPHNHNDVGSFMISSGDKVILDDIGAALYTRQNFEQHERYKIINNSSLGHSVPIVNDEAQCYGKEFCAKNTDAGDSFFKIDIEGAYESGLIEKIHREFVLEDEFVSLSDTFIYSDKTKTVTERFATLQKPEISEGVIKIGEAKITYDNEKFKPEIKTEKYQSHFNICETVYFIDFEIQDKEFKIKIFI